MTRKWLFFFLGCWLPGAAMAQLANQPPVPQWLPAGAQEQRFDGMTGLLKGILFVAGEAEVEVRLNGGAVGKAAPSEAAASFDVTASLKEKGNVLQLRSTGKMAALLELNGDLARKSWLTTDAAWTPGKPLGATDADAARNPFDFSKTFDAYNSWKLAARGAQQQATGAGDIQAPPGFRVELVRSAQADEDSWVSLAFDPQGRITLGMEKKGLLRLTVSGSGDQKIERVNDTLLECRGLLYAHDSLYANANNSKGLYRLRDKDGDGQFEEVTELLHTEGGVGHGRNHLKLGPDGRIWISHGNNVLLPKDLSPRSPLRNYADDQLIPNPWDGSMFDGTVQLPAGHILSMNPDGSDVQLVAGGLRNPLDIAFNHEGDLFTFDADMERDVGAPWYMPTRVLHVVPGADFGWRRGTGRWPAWYPDTLPSVVDIGLSSPTGVFFGYGSTFPETYRDALFILDWSYGRIIAVHLTANDSSYFGKQETFVSGRPLNVTDGAIGPDGALWFITGGRGTQSGLYRVSWTGGAPEFDPPDTPASFPGIGRRERLTLEKAAGKASSGELPSDQTLKLAIDALGSDDRHLAHGARLLLEQVPPEKWLLDGLYSGNQATRTMTGVILARIGAKAQLGSIERGALATLNPRMPLAWMGVDASWREYAPTTEAADALRALELGWTRLGRPDEATRLQIQKALVMKWNQKLYRADDQSSATSGGWPSHLWYRRQASNAKTWRQIMKLLVYLEWQGAPGACAAILPKLTTSEDLLYYPFILRYVKHGWTLESRRVVFEALNRAEKLNGASTYFKAIADTRAELAAQLTAEEGRALADVIAPPQPVALLPQALPSHTFKAWKLEDLEPQLPQVSAGRSFDGAKQALISAQCVFCHRVGADPALPAGIFGPDLTQVSARFGRRDLLDHILNPSKVIDDKFRFVTITKTDGAQVTGTLESEDDERVVLKPNPLAKDVVEVGRSSIRERKLSELSPMPAGLLNGLKAPQILDLLAWFEAGGDPRHRVFQPAAGKDK